MEKRGLMMASCLIALLLFSSVTTAQYTSAPTPPEEYWQMPALTPRVLQLPDLVITNVSLPDSLPFGSVIDTFVMTVANHGSGSADGYIKVRVQIKGLNSACTYVTELSGGSGSPTNFGYTSSLRYLSILPGQSFTLPIMDRYFRSTPSPASYCRRPLMGDATVKIWVNPVGGGTASSLTPQARLKEFNYANNYYEKTIRIGSLAVNDTRTATLRFYFGMNAFSMPIKTEMTANQFSQQSLCTLYTLDEGTSIYGGGSAGLDLSQLRLLGANEKLMPGSPYFAECSRSTTIRLTGTDPGPFHSTLVPGGVSPAASRIGMEGRFLYEMISGCSRVIGNSGAFQTQIFGYITGRPLSNKIRAEILDPRLAVIPGQLYAVSCGATAAGVWDPEDMAPKNSERILTDYVPQGGFAYGSGYRYSSRFGRFRGIAYGSD